ncbi:MAG: hypothetical protein ACI4SA_09585 [Lachnospiraceae bacterium]
MREKAGGIILNSRKQENGMREEAKPHILIRNIMKNMPGEVAPGIK